MKSWQEQNSVSTSSSYFISNLCVFVLSWWQPAFLLSLPLLCFLLWQKKDAQGLWTWPSWWSARQLSQSSRSSPLASAVSLLLHPLPAPPNASGSPHHPAATGITSTSFIWSEKVGFCEVPVVNGSHCFLSLGSPRDCIPNTTPHPWCLSRLLLVWGQICLLQITQLRAGARTATSLGWTKSGRSLVLNFPHTFLFST